MTWRQIKMLFKYVVSGTPMTSAEVRQDVAKVLSNTEGASLENLSAHCDKLLSGWVDGGAPITNWFTIDTNSETVSTLWRNHTEATPALKLWLNVKVSTTANEWSLDIMEDGTGGVILNNPNSATSGTNQLSAIPASSSNDTFYIGITDSVAFMCANNGGYATMWCELIEPNAVNPYASYSVTDRHPSMVWATAKSGRYVFQRTIRSYGPSATSVITNITDVEDSYGKQWANCWQGMQLEQWTMNNSSYYPILLANGQYGLPTIPANIAIYLKIPVYFELKGVHLALITQCHQLWGTRITNNSVGVPLFVLGLQQATTHTSPGATVFIEGV